MNPTENPLSASSKRAIKNYKLSLKLGRNTKVEATGHSLVCLPEKTVSGASILYTINWSFFTGCIVIWNNSRRDTTSSGPLISDVINPFPNREHYAILAVFWSHTKILISNESVVRTITGLFMWYLEHWWNCEFYC